MRTPATTRMKTAPFWLPVALLLSLAAASGDDSGFRPDPAGLSFENYGNEDGIVNLTPADVVRMFGDSARAGGEGDDVELVPAAQEWMEQTNAAMNGGHCEGLAVLSYLFHIGQLDPANFGAESVHGLKLEGNVPLQREIAYWWATQMCHQPGGDEHPTLVAGYQSEGADYEILARGVEASSGAMVELEIVYQIGCATVEVPESKVAAAVEIEVDRYTDEGQSVFYCDDLELATGDVAYFHFAAWDENGSAMEVDLDRGGDGKIDEEFQYQDEK